MKDKFDYIVLPPDSFHMTSMDYLSCAAHYLQDVIDVILTQKTPKDRILVKYRTSLQARNFHHDAKSAIGYGKLSDFCHENTVVVGPIGSAMQECLINGIEYYVYYDFSAWGENRYCSIEAYKRLQKLIFISQNKIDLYNNMQKKQVYRDGIKNSDFYNKNGESLCIIIQKIIGQHA